MLLDLARPFAETILACVRREYPNDPHHTLTGPDDRPLPREVHPSFYGCFDWHSAVEMHWALVRLLRIVPESMPASEARATLSEHLGSEPLAVEAAYLSDHPTFERPYWWGWALMLVHEVETWDDPHARRWAANVSPLAEALTIRYLEWLAKATYPIRVGTHGNSAFSLARALPFAAGRASEGEGALVAAIADAAERWYADDEDAPAGWEPSGDDFLSPALAEAELMSRLLTPGRFRSWLDRFLPGIADESPATLFAPSSPTTRTGISATCTGSTSHGRTAGGALPRGFRMMIRGRGSCARRQTATPKPRFRTSPEATMSSSTGWLPTPSCC